MLVKTRNLAFRYDIRPPDDILSAGNHLMDGSWTGATGQLQRRVICFSWIFWIVWLSRLLGGRVERVDGSADAGKEANHGELSPSHLRWQQYLDTFPARGREDNRSLWCVPTRCNCERSFENVKWKIGSSIDLDRDFCDVLLFDCRSVEPAKTDQQVNW